MKISLSYKIAAASALISICSFSAAAQAPDSEPGGPPPGQRWHGEPGPDRELHMLTRTLNLTVDQQKGVKAILDQQATQMEALRSKTRADSSADASAAPTPEARQAHMEQMKQIYDESSVKISALLDENQKKTYAEMQARRKANMERRQNGQEPPPPPDGAGAPPPPPQQ